jgi:hypothetical protein
MHGEEVRGIVHELLRGVAIPAPFGAIREKDLSRVEDGSSVVAEKGLPSIGAAPRPKFLEVDALGVAAITRSPLAAVQATLGELVQFVAESRSRLSSRS